MKTPAVLLCATLAIASLAACGSTLSPAEVQSSLKQATATAVAGVDATTVEVISPERSTAKWTWTAKANGSLYKCDADNQMRLPSCIVQS